MKDHHIAEAIGLFLIEFRELNSRIKGIELSLDKINDGLDNIAGHLSNANTAASIAKEMQQTRYQLKAAIRDLSENLYKL